MPLPGLLTKAQGKNYFVNNPVELGRKDWAALGGVWYFTTKTWGGLTLCQIADNGSSLQIGRAVNLGNPYSSATPNGQAARDKAYKLVMSLPASIVPGSTVTVTKPATTTTTAAATVTNINQMRVAKKKILGHAKPDGHSKTLKTVAKGTKLHVVHRTVDDQGRGWVRGPAGVWWLESETTLVQPKKTAAKPPAASSAHQTYVIRAGDNLTKIAANFGTTKANLVQLNHITDPDHIETGETLIIR